MNGADGVAGHDRLSAPWLATEIRLQSCEYGGYMFADVYLLQADFLAAFMDSRCLSSDRKKR